MAIEFYEAALGVVPLVGHDVEDRSVVRELAFVRVIPGWRKTRWTKRIQPGEVVSRHSADSTIVLMTKYTKPTQDLQSFTCPTCHVLAYQRWSSLMMSLSGVSSNGPLFPSGYKVARCDACHALSIWHNSELAYPAIISVSAPQADMPEKVKADFQEAMKIFSDSPRASCALLRLALQKLCIELGLPGENLNSDIGSLVARGLPEQIRKSLDIVRFIGNEQVHPGLIDVRDNPQIAVTLFGLLNLITEYMISNPKRIDELHGLMPDGLKAQIEKRDSKARQ